MNKKSELPSSLTVRDRTAKEQLRQSRLQFNLSYTLTAISAVLCFASIGLLWSGRISGETMLQTVDALSRIMMLSGKASEEKSTEK